MQNIISKFQIIGCECSYCQNKIHTLNWIECVPGKGNCVLRGKVEIKTAAPRKKTKEKKDN